MTEISHQSSKRDLALEQLTVQPTFSQEVGVAQTMLYPGLISDSEKIFPDREDKSRYFYFTPYHHAESGLLDEALVNNLHRGDRLLVVGAGRGDIERYLIKGCGVMPQQIDAADIDLTLYPSDLQVRTHQFDMLQLWPLPPEHYQYVLIPEAIGVALLPKDLRSASSSPMPYRFNSEVVKVSEAVLTGGPHVVSTQDAEFYLNLFEQDSPRAHRTWSIISNALATVKPGGDVRLNGHNLVDPAVAAVLLLTAQSPISVEKVVIGNNSLCFTRSPES